MIEPLRNMEEFSSRDEAEAARLLRTLGPAAPLPAVEERVLASLGRPARLGPRALRLATVVSVSVAASGVLAMTVGAILHSRAGERTSAIPAATRPLEPAPVTAPTRPIEPASVNSPALPSVPQPTAEQPEPAPAVRAERTVPRSGSSRSIADSRRVRGAANPQAPLAPTTSSAPAGNPDEAAEARVATAPPEEAALVLSGLRALRRQHDPSQAGMLFSRYLNRFPQGVLVQEALALSIEASLVRGDRQSAAQMAQMYLERFPAGRFVRLARKAADGVVP